MYLNYFDFLHNAVGIKTAADVYFRKDPKNLTLTEAATLIGLCKNPSYFNPVRFPDRCIERRNVVLGQMLKAGYITDAQYNEATGGQLALNFHRIDHKDGIATYFRDFLRRYIMTEKPELDDYPSWNRVQYNIDSIAWETDPLYGWCNKNYKKSGGHYNVYTDGLKIFTTIDSRMQKYAEEAAVKQMEILQERFYQHWGKTHPWQDERHQEIPNFIEDLAKRTTHYKYLAHRFPDQPDSVAYYLNLPHKVKVFSYDGYKEDSLSTMDSIRYMVKFLHCGFVAMEPDTRQVKAWVGDIDFGSWKYDKVTAMRQPGSTFKLFVYAEAMNQGLTPCDTRVDEWMQYPDTIDGKPTKWTPHNANGTFSGAAMPLTAPLT